MQSHSIVLFIMSQKLAKYHIRALSLCACVLHVSFFVCMCIMSSCVCLHVSCLLVSVPLHHVHHVHHCLGQCYDKGQGQSSMFTQSHSIVLFIMSQKSAKYHIRRALTLCACVLHVSFFVCMCIKSSCVCLVSAVGAQSDLVRPYIVVNL